MDVAVVLGVDVIVVMVVLRVVPNPPQVGLSYVVDQLGVNKTQ